MAGALTRVLAASALVAALGVLTTGCAGSSGEVTAGSTGSVRATTASPSDPPSVSVTPSQALGSATPAATSTEIRGTATDFCSAIHELALQISASKTVQQGVSALYQSAADMRRFAPPGLKSQANVVAKGLEGVGLNLAVGLYPSNQALAADVQKVLTTPEGNAIRDYSIANCT